ncbi:MAG: type II toxin-antitoxin system RelE/ParE family toxin [Acidithiobacillus ferriphilus]|jgi:plasmid stabilization system protein ParE|uniref:type II toxin-antitoxin system RelE/ParE family toxin n=1 Tax=Acidithiobacillus ferriphilus TaxID=1689834 RepID=UPI001C061239|nr:type II toxin-antitoxin system RelE/ParE family toxin [Acidithiobacillus ferriphilus]MBU2786460.1 type II toxin-antitoxin system RelE/ParE family toxin [Acidithiobacillus ferriphilus]MBU2828639.1 type II toxin-antitoxin system RelE/ParE family toxin [Acidithiobacillus ferriphilus]MBU2846146.1 type II toxin-antitoxin system RelE/ParE family toxin [Acidithiobacillus ferriphilus]MEB8473690.1 type II toxin-antitoxin system RelE/ParE family toxin [Acidithiobacillus ferriphilus]MEB8535826.1 type 
MSYRVVFSPEAQEQLAELYRYIAEAASPDIAAQYTEAIVSYCDSLRTFPLRGTRRDDVRPGLRITNYKKRAVIAFDVDADVVSIIGVFYGGQNYETILHDDPNDNSEEH